MAAFSTSYQTVLESDIRHMYSYHGKRSIYRHNRSYHERVLPAISLHRRYPRRFYDVYPEMNIGIPRAPAFREVRKNGMNDIIERLRKPITCQSKSGRKRCREKIESQNKETAHAPEQKKMSQEKVDEVTKRLQKDTKCSRHRHWIRSEEDLQLPPINPRNTVGQKQWMN